LESIAETFAEAEEAAMSPGRIPRRRVVELLTAAALLVTALVLAAGCGGADEAAPPAPPAEPAEPAPAEPPAESAPPETGSFGAGLELTDEVIAAPEVASIKEPWVRWNSETCAFEETADHPAEYVPELRKVGGDFQIGYMHYGDIDTFGIANSENIKSLAEEAGFTLNVYNLKYPSETEPLAQARAAAVKGDKGVITATQTLWDEQYKILAEEGCIPAVQLYSFGTAVPNFGVSWSNAGTEIGKSLAEIAIERGWDPATTALVQCTNPDYGPSVNSMFDTAPPAVKEAGFAIPDENIFNLTCKVGKHETVTTDWFTANPDFANVMFDTVDDPSADGMINAIKKAGREDDSIIIVNGADPQGRKAIRAGTETGSLAFFPERYGEWALAMLQDVLAGNPVPMEVNHPTPLITADNIDEYYPGE
jgi:ribose transport system substrate-binding protein